MESMVCYEISMLCYEISMLCYAMVYVVKDKHSAPVSQGCSKVTLTKKFQARAMIFSNKLVLKKPAPMQYFLRMYHNKQEFPIFSQSPTY